VPLHAQPARQSERTPGEGEQQTTPKKHGTVILVSLDLLAEEAGQLLADWPQITAVATSMHGCRYVRLLHDRHDEMRWVVATEWDDAAGFDDFMRKSGLQWRGRARALSDQTRYAYFDVMGSEPHPSLDQQPALSTSDQANSH
jgi:heme-degrading monooxygenase HmoA